MFGRTQERELKWAREQFPLFALRSDSEVRRILSEAQKQVGTARAVITIVGFAAGGLLAGWVNARWFAEALPQGLQITLLFVAGSLLGMAGGIAAEHVLRRRIEMIANGRPGARGGSRVHG